VKFLNPVDGWHAPEIHWSFPIAGFFLDALCRKEVKMTEIILKTNAPDKAADILKEALATEASRIKYSLNLAKKRLERFETKYNISSAKFINEWSAEDLKGEDMEYVEWAGEYQLFSRLNERLEVLESIENVAS
jgi:hypothetical protein